MESVLVWNFIFVPIERRKAMKGTYPKHAPNPKIRKNSASGNICPAPVFPIAPGFESSFSAKITNINIVLAINSLKNWLALVKKAWGYVQKIPAVAVALGGTVRIPWPST